MAMDEAEFARNHMMDRHVRDGAVRMRPGGFPEEVMTWRLVRLLTQLQSGPTSTLIVASHSKGLEGGTINQPASGADLELAIEIAPGDWIDLLLQAKRLYSDTAKYESWKQSQVEKLRAWADVNDRTPGMLLYNDRVAPFVTGTKVVQGGCSTGSVEMSISTDPPKPFPNPCAPLGVTLVVLPIAGITLPVGLQGDGLTAGAVNEHASPWECMLCHFWPARSPIPGNDLSAVSISPAMPTWAAEIVELLSSSADDQSPVVELSDVSRAAGSPTLSVVIPWAQRVRARSDGDD